MCVQYAELQTEYKNFSCKLFLPSHLSYEIVSSLLCLSLDLKMFWQTVWGDKTQGWVCSETVKRRTVETLAIYIQRNIGFHSFMSRCSNFKMELHNNNDNKDSYFYFIITIVIKNYTFYFPKTSSK